LSHQHILIGVLGGLDALIHQLKTYPKVDGWEIIPQTQKVRVQFSGNQEDSAGLLRKLMAANLTVTEFSPSQESLESIFLKLEHKQAS
jgi:ABC-2 type transport system ATP-binding protein